MGDGLLVGRLVGGGLVGLDGVGPGEVVGGVLDGVGDPVEVGADGLVVEPLGVGVGVGEPRSGDPGDQGAQDASVAEAIPAATPRTTRAPTTARRARRRVSPALPALVLEAAVAASRSVKAASVRRRDVSARSRSRSPRRDRSPAM